MRTRRITYIAIAIAVGLGTRSTVDAGGTDRGAEPTATAAESAAERRAERRRIARAGRPLYRKYCATCHGGRGDGKGPSARFLEAVPRDFRTGSYKFQMTPSGALATEADIYRTITTGVMGTAMPGFRRILHREQRRLLARYVMTFAPRFWTGEDRGDPIEIPRESRNDSASIARGKALYDKLECAGCHGESGRGDGPAAKGLKDDGGRAIKPRSLTLGYYKGGLCAVVVYRALTTGLAGTPMAGFGAALTPSERWDLVHYVTSLRRKRGVFDYLFRDTPGRITVP